MQTGSFFRLVQGLRGKCSGWSSGSSLLWAIGALVVMGLVGAGIAVMTPSTTQSKLEQEAGMRAYYNANAGLNFVVSMQNVAESENISFSNYISSMGSGGSVSYNVESDGYFTYQLGNIVTSGVNGTYQITNLIGTATNSTGGSAYGYAVFGGGKGNSAVFTYVPVGAGGSATPERAAKYVLYAGNADVVVGGSANITGDIYAKTLDIEQATINGDVIVKGKADLGYLTVINGDLCSSGDISLNQSTVSGTINNFGNIVFYYNSKAYGDVFSSGYVTEAEQTKLYGSLNAGSYVLTSGRADMYQNVYAGGNIDLNKSYATIHGNAYSGAVIKLAWGTEITGQAVAVDVQQASGSTVGSIRETTTYPPNIAPTAPTACVSDSTPPLATITTGSKNVSIGWHETTYDTSNPLPPGKYKNLTISSSAPITFTSGSYYFSSVSLGWGTKINYNITDGDINIFVKGDAGINATDGIKISTDGVIWSDIADVATAKAAKVYWESHGAGTLEWGMPWFGTLFATTGITLGGKNSPVIGALVTSGNLSNIDWDADIVYVPSNYAIQHW